MPLRHSHDPEAVFLVRGQGRRVVCPDIREDLFVAFPPRHLKCGRKKTFGDAMPSACKINIGTDNANMIESVRVCGKRRHALKADYRLVAGPYGDVKDVTVGEARDVRTFGFESE